MAEDYLEIRDYFLIDEEEEEGPFRSFYIQVVIVIPCRCLSENTSSCGGRDETFRLRVQF